MVERARRERPRRDEIGDRAIEVDFSILAKRSVVQAAIGFDSEAAMKTVSGVTGIEPA
jgi:hypothetical protein